jgi:cell division protein FtsX
MNLITNYYFNNKFLLDEIVKLINIKKLSENLEDNIQIGIFLKNNIENIEYYQNKEEILKKV